MTTEEQIELGKRLKQKDRDAFHTLYREYFHKLHTYAWHYVYDNEIAKDMAQSAFLSLWTHIDHFDENKKIGAYLVGIVKNACLEHFRSLRIKDSHADKVIEAVLFANLEENELDEDEEMKTRLSNAMEHIPHKARIILIAHFVERKKVKTIAEELQIAESTVKTHLKRAMQILRKNLLFILFGIGILEI